MMMNLLKQLKIYLQQVIIMHYSVLLKKAVSGLNIKKDGIYVDCTLGYGGHSEAILKSLDSGLLIGFDQDMDALTYASKRLSLVGNNFKLVHSNFVELKQKLNELKWN